MDEPPNEHEWENNVPDDDGASLAPSVADDTDESGVLLEEMDVNLTHQFYAGYNETPSKSRPQGPADSFQTPTPGLGVSFNPHFASPMYTPLKAGKKEEKVKIRYSDANTYQFTDVGEQGGLLGPDGSPHSDHIQYSDFS
jgi:hypothetical protein